MSTEPAKKDDHGAAHAPKKTYVAIMVAIVLASLAAIVFFTVTGITFTMALKSFFGIFRSIGEVFTGGATDMDVATAGINHARVSSSRMLMALITWAFIFVMVGLAFNVLFGKKKDTGGGAHPPAGH